jgi:hypothetical protein
MPSESETQPTILLESVRLRLSILWLVGSGVILLMLIAQSLMGKYQNKTQEVWGWMLPTILPALSLILSVLGASALAEESGKTRAKRSFFLIAYLLSAVYLFLVFATMLIEPFTSFEPLELLKLSNLWLAPLQGLVTSALGVLFFTKKTNGEPASRAG